MFFLILFLFLLNYGQSKKHITTGSPGQWSTYGPWGECSKTCGIGVKRRSRVCSYTGTDKERRCRGNAGILKNCDTKITCPIHGGWSSWEAWKCTVTCGGGDGVQKRSCTNPKPMFGGRGCEGAAEEKGKCNMQKCPDEIFTLSPMTAEAIKTSLTREHNNFEKKEGESARMICSPTAIKKIYEDYPKTTLIWTKNGKVLKIDHDRMDVTPTEITLRKLSSNDSGIYVCSAQYAPQVIKPISVTSVAIESSTPDIKVPADDSMKLICYGTYLAKIFKNVTQKLLLNGVKYKDFGIASPLENNVYEIKDVKKNMSGKWSCIGKDPLSNKQWTTNIITVDVLPPVPKLLKILKDKRLLLTIGSFLCILIMLIGAVFAYINIKTREEYLKDFVKWCQIVEWEEMKAGGTPKWDEEEESL